MEQGKYTDLHGYITQGLKLDEKQLTIEHAGYKDAEKHRLLKTAATSLSTEVETARLG